VEYDPYDRPGGWVLEQARQHEQSVIAVLGSTAAVVLTALVLAFGHVLSFASGGILLGVVLLLRWFGNDVIDEWARWSHGGLAEEKVGRLLDELAADGSIVVHDLRDRHGGNIDHLVNSPYGVYLIETKAAGWATEEQLRKVKRQAVSTGSAIGVRWVAPVICLNARRGGITRKGVATILPPAELLGWIRSQRNSPAGDEPFRRFLDGL